MDKGRSDPQGEGTLTGAFSRLLDRVFPGRVVHRRGATGSAERLERARATVARAAGAPVTADRRRELIAAAAELEALGDVADAAVAAEGYARAGDIEAQGRALARAGDVEQLQTLLEADRERALDAGRRRVMHQEFETRIACGRRREAADLARGSNDGSLRERGRDLERRRVPGPAIRAVVRGRPALILLGERVVVGRTGASIVVPSPLLSREHLAIERARSPGGAVVVRDLGSRNGTLAGGAPLRGEAVVGEGIELRLGGEVAVVVRPASLFPGAVSVDVGGATYLAPLGPAHLGIGRWRLERAEGPPGDGGDGGPWIELVTDDEPTAYAGDWRLDPRVTLLAGDAVSTERGAGPTLEIQG